MKNSIYLGLLLIFLGSCESPKADEKDQALIKLYTRQKNILKHKCELEKSKLEADVNTKFVFSFIWMKVGGASLSRHQLNPSYNWSRTSDIIKTDHFSESYPYHFLDSVENAIRIDKHSTIRSVVKRKLYVFKTREEAKKAKKNHLKKYKGHF